MPICMKLTRLRYLVPAAVLTLMTVPLDANVLVPGASGVIPDVFPNPGNVPLLDTVTGTFSFGSGAGLITGTYVGVVAVDPFGVTCAGCLDFAYQISLDSGLSAGIFTSSVGRFGGYSTDVGYITGTGNMGGGGGDGAPISVNRGPFGGGIGFIFVQPGAGAAIGPGGSSAVLIVATNATTYDSQGVLGMSGGTGTIPSGGQITGLFEPTFLGPEPSTMLLLGLGLAGIGAIRKRTTRSGIE